MTGLYSENADMMTIVALMCQAIQRHQKMEVKSMVADGGHMGCVLRNAVPNYIADTVIKCHSRQPSASYVDQRDKQTKCNDTDDEMTTDCGILTCRPNKKSFQKFARIKVSHRTILLLFLND